MQCVRLSLIAMIAVLMLSACASGDDERAAPGSSAPAPSSDSTPGSTSSAPTPSLSSTPSPSEVTPSPEEPAVPTVEVRIANERVSPNAEKVDLSAGESLVFEIVSDRAGELHVHSKPEQYVKFGDGRTRAEISVTTPGSVKVEEHDTSAVVAIVEVR